MITLDDYLDAASRQRWAWGEVDCIQFGHAWIVAKTGRDLPVPFSYHDAETARAFIEANGGMLAIVTRWMEANGFERTDDPEDGDIGLVAVPDVPGINRVGEAAVVIRYACWWIAKAPRGIASADARGAPAWRIC